MKINNKNRTIVNIFGGPFIVFSILYHKITFLLLVFFIFAFSLYEYISLIKEKSELTFYKLFIGFFWVALIFCFLPIYNIQDIGKNFVLVIFLSVWVTDSMAFIMGKKFGKKKIFPTISPNKTWVGSIAGLVSAILFLLAINNMNSIFYDIWPENFKFSDILYIGFIVGFFGQFGDFLESYFKRKLDVKDSSNLLLGHGGFLDRFDSMFIVGATISLYLFLTGHYNG
tara:strand:+ start:1009 stop:1689 length:681 start_codon:yes stop_codon:yes gene_type:complete